MRKNSFAGCVATCVCAWMMTASTAEAQTIVLYASDAVRMNGHWSRVNDSSAAGGSRLNTPDSGASTINTPLASPTNYAEFTFDAPAGTTFRMWVRLRAQNNSLNNDSLYAQFSDAITTTGATVYRIGTTSALLLREQYCECPVSGWGWVDGSYEVNQLTTLRFSGSGTHTIRIQTREDGIQLDQIVLSSSTYLTTRPGLQRDDTTIVPKPAAPAPPTSTSSTPFTGTAVGLPGTIQAEAFDNGGSGVAFSDGTSANEGGAYRQTAVDLEPASSGGYNVGWTAPGEWLLYSVNVASTASYLLEARVASGGQGGTFHIESNGTNLTGSMTIPNTGDWQIWQTISKTVSLTAGSQRLKLVFDSNGVDGAGNIDWVRLTQTTQTQTPPPAPSTPAIALPGSFGSERFADGGEGVGYHDTTAGNSGGAYRSTDVDIESCLCGGYNVGWTQPGEWLAYPVDVSSAGNYTITLRVATPVSTGRLHITSGSSSTAVTSVPNTGDWQLWSSMTVPITLAAGLQTMKIVFDAADINIAGITVAQVTSTSTPPTTEQPSPPTSSTGSVKYVNAGADLQAAINAAVPGDTLMLAAGASFVGNFVLPNKSGSSYITIRSSASDTALPDETTRITPVYASNLPKLRSPNSAPALKTAPGAHNYRIQFIEFQANHQGLYDIIQLGDGSGAQTSLSAVPRDLVLDRVYIHGDPTWGQKRAIGLNSASTTIINSYISEIRATSQDSQGIAGWNGPGPFLISNNYIEAASENVLFGGSDPAINGLIPSDITFTRNHLTKKTSWRGQSFNVKNLFELKNAQRVVVNGNIMENNWMEAQSGYAVLFTVRNQDGGAPWSIIQHVQFTNNIVRHSASGINILATDYLAPSQTSHDITIRNNLFDDITGATWGGSGRFLLVNGGYNITVDHNTVIQDGLSALYIDSNKSTGFVFTNNIVPDNSWAVMGGGTAPGNGTISTWLPGSTFLHNVFAAANWTIYPANNFFPASMSAVGFVNLSGGDYRLSSSSPYRSRGTDGSDVGCDITALNSATAGVK